MSCYSCSIFSFYNGCCPYTQWSSKEDKCVGMFTAFYFILLHEYCYLDITPFVALTQTYTHDCIIAHHGTINCTLLLSLLTQNVFITYARLLFSYYLLKLQQKHNAEIHVILINFLHQYCVILCNLSIFFMSCYMMFLTFIFSCTNCIVCKEETKNQVFFLILF